MKSKFIIRRVFRCGTILLFTLMINFSFAQKDKLIKGKWSFKDVEDRAKLDSITLKHSTLIFRNMEMEFGDDGKYTYANSLVGNWAWSSDSTKVIVTLSNPSNPTDKKTSELNIKGLSSKELKLTMGKAVIIFGRPAIQLATKNNQKKVDENVTEKKITDTLANTNVTATTPQQPVKQTVPIVDPTIFVRRLNDFIVFKVEGAGFGLKDDNNQIVFPAVLSGIDSAPARSFAVSINGYYFSSAYFGDGRFMGDMNCDVCDGSGFVDKDYHLSKDTKKTVHRSYLGGGVWEQVTITTTTPPRDVTVNARCGRCSGLGKMKGGIDYINGNIKVWTWKDEREKSRN